MKKYISILAAILMFVFAFSMMATSTHAAGDKVRGDKAEGPANQNGECPWTG